MIRKRERRSGALAATLVLATSLLASALSGPVTARTASTHSLKASGSIVRKVGGKDVKFKVVLDALESSHYEFVSISISRTKNPPGSAPAFLEKQVWSHTLDAGSVVVTDDLQSGSIDTGEQMGGWGKIQLEFSGTGPKQEGCNQFVQKRPGTMSEPPGGTFKFKTGNAVFGAIESVPAKAIATDGSCQPYLARAGAEACPPDHRNLFGQGSIPLGSLYLDTGKNLGAEKATLEMGAYEDIDMERSRFALSKGKIPASKLQITSDLHTAEVQIPNDVPFLSGELSASHQAAMEEGDSYDCGSGKQYTLSGREGYVNGAVEMKLTGRPKDVLDDTLEKAETFVQKRVVHNAP